MNARLEAAARALNQFCVDLVGWPTWDDLNDQQRHTCVEWTRVVLAAADALDTTEWGIFAHGEDAPADGSGLVSWADTVEEAVEIIADNSTSYPLEGPYSLGSRRVGPWVPVTERNDQ